MSHRREDVVHAALRVLDQHGLGSLTMRRLARELDVAPSALYWHVASKQELLAAVAEQVLAVRGLDAPDPARRRADDGSGPGDPPSDPWAAAEETCRALREAMQAYRDGAEVVALAWSLGLGAREPYARLRAALGAAGLPEGAAQVGARALLHHAFGHVQDEQTHLQAVADGALGVAGPGPVPDGAPGREAEPEDPSASYRLGVGLLLDGLRVRAGVLPDVTGS